jgi:hypothetical protein
MKTLNTNCYGISISSDPSNKSGASISSAMKKQDTLENKTFNTAVDGLESIILAHFCAGLDITSPAYLEGIETAYQALGNNIDEDTTDEDVVTIQKSRRVNASADETIHYEINKADWEAALDEHESEEIALLELQRELKVKRSFYEVEIDEIIAEFEVDVVEI